MDDLLFLQTDADGNSSASKEGRVVVLRSSEAFLGVEQGQEKMNQGRVWMQESQAPTNNTKWVFGADGCLSLSAFGGEKSTYVLTVRCRIVLIALSLMLETSVSRM